MHLLGSSCKLLLTLDTSPPPYKWPLLLTVENLSLTPTLNQVLLGFIPIAQCRVTLETNSVELFRYIAGVLLLTPAALHLASNSTRHAECISGYLTQLMNSNPRTSLTSGKGRAHSQLLKWLLAGLKSPGGQVADCQLETKPGRHFGPNSLFTLSYGDGRL